MAIAQHKRHHWPWFPTLLVLVGVLPFWPPSGWLQTPATQAKALPDWPEDSLDLSKEPLVNLLSRLMKRDSKQRQAARRELERRGDPRAVPGLIEILRLPSYAERDDVYDLLRKFTGKDFGDNWLAWSEWLTGQEQVELPPQFLEWKAAVFRLLLDPAFGKFLYPGLPLRIRIEEIVWGGVKKDGIPALIRPKMVKAPAADYLDPQDLVFGVEINGDARAYPLRIMDWHEMLNDVIGGVPVSLAYCTLCRSGILFDTTVDGRIYTFGSSGLLYRSNKLMYDHQTESLWMTIPGEPVSGPLAYSGIKLKKLPLVVTTWQDWRRTHPETSVLSLETGYQRDYRPGAAYGDYYASPDPMFPVPHRDNRLRPKEEVFTLIVNGQPKAYLLKRLRRDRILNDTLGGENLVLLTNPQTGAVRAYARGVHLFNARKGSDDIMEAADGSVWSVTETALVNKATREQLSRLAGHLSYWFGWSAFYPRTLLYDGKGAR